MDDPLPTRRLLSLVLVVIFFLVILVNWCQVFRVEDQPGSLDSSAVKIVNTNISRIQAPRKLPSFGALVAFPTQTTLFLPTLIDHFFSPQISTILPAKYWLVTAWHQSKYF